MDEMRCPNCGVTTRQGRFCARCGAPLASGQDESQTAASTPPPPTPTGGPVPPPPTIRLAPPPPPKQPSPPFAPMPPSQAPVPPPKGKGAAKAIIAGVLGLLMIAAAVVLLLGFAVGPKWFVGEKNGKAAETDISEDSGDKDAKGEKKDSGKDGGEKGGAVTGIVVPMPPGWQHGSEVMGGDMADLLESGVGGTGTIEAFYADSSMTKMIIAMSIDNKGFSDLPPEDATLTEMNEYIEKNREELLGAFTSGLLSGGASGADVGSIKAFQTKAGDVGVEIPLRAGMGNALDLGADILVFFKSDKTFVVMLMSMAGPVPPDTVKLLKDDITFK